MAPLILNSLTEKDLLQQCLDGDRIAQKQIFELYAPKMMSVCKRYGRHRLEAEEIMQDGLKSSYTNLEKLSKANQRDPTQGCKNLGEGEANQTSRTAGRPKPRQGLDQA